MALELRPHHLLDIISDVGHGIEFHPHPYGHAQHLVVAQLLADPDQEVAFVIGADAICQGCRHLHSDGSCDDVLGQLAEPVSKQQYNDDLDRRLWPILELDQGRQMTVRAFLARVAQRLPGIETICTHPGEDQASRREGLYNGIVRLGGEEIERHEEGASHA